MPEARHREMPAMTFRLSVLVGVLIIVELITISWAVGSRHTPHPRAAQHTAIVAPYSPVVTPGMANESHPGPQTIAQPDPVMLPALSITKYVVRPGDTLTAIAALYHIPSYQTIYAVNLGTIGADPNLIRPGMSLVIPIWP